MKRLSGKVRNLLLTRKMNRKVRNTFILFACVVVFVTTYALILPAITMEKGALICGMEVHEHTDKCYKEVLTCGFSESEDHTHDASCYTQVLVCEKEQHVHVNSCYEEAEEPLDEEPYTEEVAVIEETPTTEGEFDIEKESVIESESDVDSELTTEGNPDPEDETAAEEEITQEDEITSEDSITPKDPTAPEEESTADEAPETEESIVEEESRAKEETLPEKESFPEEETESSSELEETIIEETIIEETTIEETTEEETVPVSYPAQTFQATTDYVMVNVIAPEDAFPAGTAMMVRDVDDPKTMDTISETVRESGEENQEILQIHAVDITFCDINGEKIEPAIPIQVNIVPLKAQSIIETDVSPVVIHVDDTGEAEVIEQKAPEEILQPEVVDNKNEGEDAVDAVDTVVFDADAFSVYAVAYTQLQKTVITASGETYEITVTCGADAEIPAEADLDVRELTEGSEEYNSYLQRAAERLGLVSSEVSFARFFDIAITDKNGGRVEPAAPVQVDIAYREAMDVRDPQNLNVVHFAEDGLEVIPDIELSGDNTEIRYTQESFSVTGTIINGMPEGGDKKYMILIRDGARYFIVNNDASLTEVGFVENGGDQGEDLVVVTEPMLWTSEQNGEERHLYFNSEATGFGMNLIASDYYRRYLDPSSEQGWLQEQSTDPGKAGYVTLHKDGSFINNGTSVEINHVENRSNVVSATSLRIDGDGRISHGNYYLAIQKDDAGNPVRLISQQGSENAAQFIFATASRVPDGNHLKNAVNHIDISIQGDAQASIPLAYGVYYDANKRPILTVTENQKLNLTKEQAVDPEQLKITSEDMKRASITARDKNGNELNDAFYIAGFSANTSTNISTVQVRIEGQFLCADLRGTEYEEIDSRRYDGYWEGWYYRWPDQNYVNAVRWARLQNKVDYTVAVVKPVTYNLVHPTLGQLYDEEGKPLQVTVDVAFSGSFNYWDEGENERNSGNECPPIQGNAAWRQGDIPNHDLSGMDFVLKGIADVEESPVVAIEIVKTILDDQGNIIEVKNPVTNTFDIYQNRTAERNGVADMDVNGYKGDDQRPEFSGIYDGYERAYTKTATIKEGQGSATVYSWNVPDGMYYIQERSDGDSLPETIEDEGGNLWTYEKTYIKTEYVRRGDTYDTDLNPMHVSRDYRDRNEPYKSAPEVAGNFVTLEGKVKKSGFLEYYVYNVYTRDKKTEAEKVTPTVQKIWQPAPGSDAYVKVQLKRCKRPDPEDDIPDPHEMEKIQPALQIIWKDSDNQDRLRPEEVKAGLYKGSEKVGEVTLNAENNWRAAVDTPLPKYTAGGKNLYYIWKEPIITGYHCEGTSLNTETYTTDMTFAHEEKPDREYALVTVHTVLYPGTENNDWNTNIYNITVNNSPLSPVLDENGNQISNPYNSYQANKPVTWRVPKNSVVSFEYPVNPKDQFHLYSITSPVRYKNYTTTSGNDAIKIWVGEEDVDIYAVISSVNQPKPEPEPPASVYVTMNYGGYKLDKTYPTLNNTELPVGASISVVIKTKNQNISEDQLLRYWETDGVNQSYDYGNSHGLLKSKESEGEFKVYTFTISDITKDITIGAKGQENDGNYEITASVSYPESGTSHSGNSRKLEKAAFYSNAGKKLSSGSSAPIPEGYVEDVLFTDKKIELTLSEETGWKQSFPEQDKYDKWGREYIYYVEETGCKPNNYVVDSFSGDILSEEGVTIKNKVSDVSLVIRKTISGISTWPSDKVLTFVIRGPGLPEAGIIRYFPEDFTINGNSGEVRLTQTDGIQAGATYMVTESGNGMNLPGYTRTTTMTAGNEEITCDPTEGDDVTGNVDTDKTGAAVISFHNQYNQITVNIPVKKIWSFATPSALGDAMENGWPKDVTVTVALYQKIGEIVTDTNERLTLDASNCEGEFTGLPTCQGDQPITYSVKETGMEGVDSGLFDTSVSGDAASGFTITNIEKQAGLTITKIFTGESLTEEQMGDILFTVTGPGIPRGKIEQYYSDFEKVDEDSTTGTWTLTQEDGIRAGEEYTVTETNPIIGCYTRITKVKVNDSEAEEVTPTEEDSSGEAVETEIISSQVTVDYETGIGIINITNEYSKKKTSIGGSKIWVDERSHDNAKEITLTLYRRIAEDEESEYQPVPDSEYTFFWRKDGYLFDNLDQYVTAGTNPDPENEENIGKEFEYKVEETNITVKDDHGNLVPYRSEVTQNAIDGVVFSYDFTNTEINTQMVNLEIFKVDAADMVTPLAGALFELRPLDEEKTSIRYTGDAENVTYPITTGTDHRTGTNGSAVFEDLKEGYYEIHEKELPPGYILTDSDGKIYIKVEAGEVKLLTKLEGQAPKEWPVQEDVHPTLRFNVEGKLLVGNTAGAALPNTGGRGTRHLYILGSLMMILGGSWILCRHRR